MPRGRAAETQPRGHDWPVSEGLAARGLAAARRADPLLGVVSSIAAVGLVTIVIALLKGFVPVLSLGALYVFAVLPIAIAWGLAFAIGVSLASMLLFNFLFLTPVHSFTLSDSRTWLALAVYVVTSAVVSELAARSRRRAIESELLAEIARSLLERRSVSGELDRIAAGAASALGAGEARIELGEPSADVREDAGATPLMAGARRVGTIALRRPRRLSRRASSPLLPALASLLAVAIDQERLAREVLEAEALRRSDALKTALLRTVSHDLRSPLMTILTSASALSRPELALAADDRDELLAGILSEAQRLDRLVSNLLDLSRLQAGVATPAPEVWAADSLVVQALSSLGESADRVDVTLSDVSPVVRVDANQIERVLANLIENAIKYSPDHAAHVVVSATAREALVRVVDHGPGIAPEEIQRVFAPFQRGTVGDVGGAGLGLAIARGFAEANGGRVWAESLAGQGATFVLALPIAAVGEDDE
jgi:two-component system sensor histidine kinase KdpD